MTFNSNSSRGALTPAIKACFALTLGVLMICGCVACANNDQKSSASAESSQTASTGSSEGSSAASDQSSSEAASSATSSESSDGAYVDEEELVEIMGEEDAAKLLAGLEGNADRYWIATHPEAYDLEGENVQEKLLRLAAEEDDAVKYVRDFPERYYFDEDANEGGFGPGKKKGSSTATAQGSVTTQNTAASEDDDEAQDASVTSASASQDSAASSVSADAADASDSTAAASASDASASADSASTNSASADSKGNSSNDVDDEGYPTVKTGTKDVPHIYQWDQQWGYAIYSSTAFGLTGCGPTALTIAYQGVTGKRDINPYEMGKIAFEMGYMSEFEGTDGNLMTGAAPQLGMDCEVIAATEESLIEALKRGLVVVDNMGDGYFSHYGGHYLVLTGLDDKGKIVMNDPYSAVNSRKTWDADFLLNETMCLYAFSKAGGNAFNGLNVITEADEGYYADDVEDDADNAVDYEAGEDEGNNAGDEGDGNDAGANADAGNSEGEIEE